VPANLIFRFFEKLKNTVASMVALLAIMSMMFKRPN